MGLLDGKVATIAGSARGIGREAAKAMTAEGARVVVADINEDGVQSLASELTAAGHDAVAVAYDASDEASIRALIDTTIERFGQIDVLVNNAAECNPAVMAADDEIATMDADLWDHIMRVNLRGVMLGCKHAIPHMRAAGGGAIVNTTSGASLLADYTRPAYGTSKIAVNLLSQIVATRYGKDNIRCNAVSPGLMLTEATRQAMTPELIDLFEKHHVLPRLGRPEDIADMMVFLASDRAAFVTGQIIGVDGGIVMHNPTYADVRDLIEGGPAAD